MQCFRTTVVNAAGDEPARGRVGQLLRRAGLSVADVNSVAELLRLAADRPGLVILGASLDGTPGLDLCRRLKTEPATRHAPVLYLTPAGDSAPAPGGAEPDACLPHGVDAAALQAVVAAWLRVRGAEGAARDLATRWHAAGELLDEGVGLVGPDGAVRAANTAFAHLLERAVGSLVGRPLADVLGPPASGPCPVDELRATGRRVTRDLHVGPRRLRLAVEPLRDETDTLTGGVVVLTDVTGYGGEAAEALAHARAARIRELERELAAFEQLAAGGPGAHVTARCSGGGPLRETSAEAFDAVVRRYAELLDLALDERRRRVSHRLSELLQDLSEHLGGFGAGPRDVIEVHTRALKDLQAKANPKKAQVYMEEGRMLVLELMGHLLSYYRRYASAARPAPAGKPVGRGGKP